MFTGMICLIGISPSDISWDIGNQTSLAGESTVSFDGFPSYKPSLYRVLSHIFPWFSHDFRTSQLGPFKIVPVSATNGSAPAAHSSVGNQSAAWKRPGQTSPVSRRFFFWFPLGIQWGYHGMRILWEYLWLALRAPKKPRMIEDSALKWWIWGSGNHETSNIWDFMVKKAL